MRAAEYLRYSCFGQREQSIEGQRDDCDTFADRAGLEIVERYIDRAESGRSTEGRDDFHRMIADARRGLFDVVLVWKYDRFARNEYESLTYENKLAECGVKLVSVMEPVPEGAVGNVTKGMLRLFAQFYSEDLREKIERGMRITAEKGNSTGGRTPLGYKSVGDKDGHRLEIDPATAPFIRKAFEMYAAGYPLKEIADALCKMGARSRTGGPFTFRSLSHIFGNEKYVGVYSYDGQYRKEGGIPAIIDRELWERAQSRRKQACKVPSTAKARAEYLLSMKLFCGHCGALMAGESGRGRHGTVYHYYKCATRKKGGAKACDKKIVRKDEIEQHVARVIQSVMTDEWIEEVAVAVCRELEEQSAQGRRTIPQIETEIRDQEKKILNLVTAIASAGHSDALLAALTEAEDGKKFLESELRWAQDAKRLSADPALVVAFLRRFQAGRMSDPVWMREVFDTFVGRVYLWDDGRCRIFLNTSDQEIDFPFVGGSSEVLNGPTKKTASLDAVFFFCSE